MTAIDIEFYLSYYYLILDLTCRIDKVKRENWRNDKARIDVDVIFSISLQQGLGGIEVV